MTIRTSEVTSISEDPHETEIKKFDRRKGDEKGRRGDPHIIDCSLYHVWSRSHHFPLFLRQQHLNHPWLIIYTSLLHPSAFTMADGHTSNNRGGHGHNHAYRPRVGVDQRRGGFAVRPNRNQQDSESQNNNPPTQQFYQQSFNSSRGTFGGHRPAFTNRPIFNRPNDPRRIPNENRLFYDQNDMRGAENMNNSSRVFESNNRAVVERPQHEAEVPTDASRNVNRNNQRTKGLFVNRNKQRNANRNFDFMNPHADPESQRSKLEENLKNGSYECMICCEEIRISDAIWSCNNSCFNIFHLNCISTWACADSNDTRADQRNPQASAASGAAAPSSGAQNTGWRCPACQTVVERIPNRYYCFCEKVRNPQTGPENIPHTCGQMCLKRKNGKNSNCPHKCKLNCHPGPCEYLMHAVFYDQTDLLFYHS